MSAGLNIPVKAHLDSVEQSTKRVLFTAVKNEAVFLLEWIAYHRAIGFDRIIVFSNPSDDGTDELLEALAEAGEIEHFAHVVPKGFTPQANAARIANEKGLLRNGEWVIWLDADEFLVVNKGDGKVDDLVASLDGADGALIAWRLMGDGGNLKNPGRFVSEDFTRAGPTTIWQSREAKTFFKKSDGVLGFALEGINRPLLRADSSDQLAFRTSNGEKIDRSVRRHRRWLQGEDFWMSARLMPEEHGYELAQINHYCVRTPADFLLKKRRGRGAAVAQVGATNKRHTADFYWKMNGNEFEERKILRFKHQTDLEIQRLREIKSIDEAEKQAQMIRADQIEQLDEGDLAQLSKGAPTKLMPRVKGEHYLKFMQNLHRALKPKWYFEIGTQTGASLVLSSANSIAVDPDFQIVGDPYGNKSQLHMFQQTSDEFFASNHLDAIGARIDLAFLDGMHLYEYLLRDFMNTERHMSPDGVILLHDCVPWNEGMAERDRAKSPTQAWTGDVWKVVCILQSYRPDLQVEIYDCAPTGLVAVSGLDPSNRVLDSAYDEIIRLYDARQDTRDAVSSFELTAASSSPWSPFVARPEDSKLAFAIQLPVPRPRGQLNWGDFHFGMGLAKALRRQGADARVQTKLEWKNVNSDDEIDLVIRGRQTYTPRPGHRLMYWLISQDGLTHEEELSAADHIFVSGGAAVSPLQQRYGDDKVSLLLQAFDADRMRPPEEEKGRNGYLFVGIARPWERPMVSYALASNTAIELRGDGWETHAAAKWRVGGRVLNKELPQHYHRAKAVLNDHTDVMRTAGLPSNRIFDALACGAAVVSDDIAWLPDDLSEFVEIASTPEQFVSALERIDCENETRLRARRDFAMSIRDLHSFDQRAAEILQVAESMGSIR